MSKRALLLSITLFIGLGAIVLGLFVMNPVAAIASSEAAAEVAIADVSTEKMPSEVTYSDVNWTWDDPSNPVGESQLIRTNNGVSGRLSTSGLPAGQAVTAWFIFWNYPDLCSDGECGLDDLGDGTGAMGDFHLVTGHVIGRSGRATFAGNLKVGDLSTSGLNEYICPDTQDCGIALERPEAALVVLAVHSHGPAQTGQVLKEQISSYTGGCEVYLPAGGGFAQGPWDVPDEIGECTTIQMSPHAPSGS
jgi:hypothetical protein